MLGETNLNNRASLIAQLVKNPPAMQETPVWFLGPLEIPWRRNRLPNQYSWASLEAQLVKNLPAMRNNFNKNPFSSLFIMWIFINREDWQWVPGVQKCNTVSVLAPGNLRETDCLQLCPLASCQLPSESYFSSLSLHLLIYKMGIITATSLVRGRIKWETYI